MKLLLLAFVVGLVLATTSCTNPINGSQDCFGRVIKVEDRPGLHVSPVKGHQPLTCITLRLISVGAKPTTDTVTLLVLDVYSPAAHGSVGDEVRFTCSEAVLHSGVCWWEDLRALEIHAPGR